MIYLTVMNINFVSIYVLLPAVIDSKFNSLADFFLKSTIKTFIIDMLLPMTSIQILFSRNAQNGKLFVFLELFNSFQ